MFAIYGVEADTINLGQRETRRCAACDVLASFHLLLWYRFYHVFFLLGAVVEKRHFLQCPSCGQALPTEEPPELNTTRRIPLNRRIGLYVWLAAVLLLAVPLIVQEYSKI